MPISFRSLFANSLHNFVVLGSKLGVLKKSSEFPFFQSLKSFVGDKMIMAYHFFSIRRYVSKGDYIRE